MKVVPIEICSKPQKLLINYDIEICVFSPVYLSPWEGHTHPLLVTSTHAQMLSLGRPDLPIGPNSRIRFEALQLVEINEQLIRFTTFAFYFFSFICCIQS